MSVNKINEAKINLLDAIKDIENQIQSLSQQDPLFGFISTKYIKCGRESCKCKQSPKALHGPYFYLRLEPEYKFSKYLGRKVPAGMKDRISVGTNIKELERKRKRLTSTLDDIDFV